MKPKTLLLSILTLVLFFVLTIPVWLKVDALPLRMWDESRNAINAIEMFESHNWLIRTWKEKPEVYELKPPLLTWLQVASLSLFGLNELAIRLPAVVFSIATLVLVFKVCFDATKSRGISLLGVGITSTSAGFYGEHVGRFGDHDALLVFFGLLFVYQIHLFITALSNKHLYWAATSFVLAVMTKSVAVFLLFPGLFLFLTIYKNWAQLLSNKHFYRSVLLGVTPIFIYYGLRGLYQPGYLSLVWEGELFPRFFNTSKDCAFDEHTYNYYIKQLIQTQMRHWVWMFGVVLAAPFLSKRVSGQWCFWAVQPLIFILILSMGTKNFWYVAPAIPMLAIAFSLSLYHIIIGLFRRASLWYSVAPLLLIFPFIDAHAYALNPAEKYYTWETNGISYYLKDERHTSHLNNNTQILLDTVYGLEPHLFYVKKLELERGVVLPRVHHDRIESGDTLLVSHRSVYDYLQGIYSVTTLDSSYKHTKLVVIENKTF